MHLTQVFIKRLFDVLLSLFGLITSGLIIFVAWIIACIETKSNGFFIQKRVGINDVTESQKKTVNEKDEMKVKSKKRSRHVAQYY